MTMTTLPWIFTSEGLSIKIGFIVEFDFKSFPLHFNAFGAEGEPLRDADPTLVSSESNIRPVVPSMANLNLNGYVPRVVDYVTSVLAR